MIEKTDMSIGQFLKVACNYLEKMGIPNAAREARLLVAYGLNISPAEVFAYPERHLPALQGLELQTLLERRAQHEPFAKIVGEKEFWGLSFKVTYDTLDPRPESETIIQAILENHSNRSYPYQILDLGTGTGCLLLSTLIEFTQSWGIGVDASTKALEIAQDNSQRLLLSERVFFCASNWMGALTGTFDIIMSNPPYIGHNEVLLKGVTKYEPSLALFADNEGLSHYQFFANHLKSFLKPEGKLFLEIGYQQAQAVSQLFIENDWQILHMYHDLLNHPRCLVIQRKYF